MDPDEQEQFPEPGDSDHWPQDEYIDTLADDLETQKVKVG